MWKGKDAKMYEAHEAVFFRFQYTKNIQHNCSDTLVDSFLDLGTTYLSPFAFVEQMFSTYYDLFFVNNCGAGMFAVIAYFWKQFKVQEGRSKGKRNERGKL